MEAKALGEQGFSVFELNLVGQEPFSQESPTDMQEPLEPTIDTTEQEMDERFVFYPNVMRAPSDVVLSGPVIGGWGPGRYFQSKARAFEHFVEKYGNARVRKLDRSTKGRWAFLIKGLKGPEGLKSAQIAS